MKVVYNIGMQRVEYPLEPSPKANYGKEVVC